MFGTQIMFDTNHLLFLMHCTEHKLRAEHTFDDEHIVPKFNGAEVRIPLLVKPICAYQNSDSDLEPTVGYRMSDM